MKAAELLHKIQQDLKVEKTHYNKFSDFFYRNAEDILKAVKPLLTGTGAVILLTDDVLAVGDRIFLKAEAALILGDEKISCNGFAQHAASKTKMDDAQLTGSCSSYARKYALCGLLMLDEGKDPDSPENPQKMAGRQIPPVPQTTNMPAANMGGMVPPPPPAAYKR